MKDEFMEKWAVDGMPADKIRLANAAYDAGAESKQRTREEEIEAFERMISNDYKNMEKIEKSGENYMHSRTNTAFWVWLARAELER